jgi:surface protein
MVFTPATKTQLQSALAKWYEVANNSSDSDAVNTANSVTEAQYNANPGTVKYYGNPNTWDVSGITDMSTLFQFRRGNNDPDISTWDVSNVTNMVNMFQYNNDFNQPIGNWNVSSVTNMKGMFYGAKAFNQNINTKEVTAENSPTGQAYTAWNVSQVTAMNGMFNGAAAFNQAIGQWNVSQVTSMNSMFSGATTFNQDISQWNVSQVTTMFGMFDGATAFNGDISQWDVSQVTTMGSMFIGAKAFNQDINTKEVTAENSPTGQAYTAWNVSQVTNMNGMFDRAAVFNQDISQWNVSQVTSMNSMFYNASAFNQDIVKWDVSSVTNMGYMFSNAHAFNGDISGWKVGNVTNMARMFSNAHAFNGDISGWNTSKVTDMSYMFSGASSFNQPIGTWNTSNVANMSYMFYNASAFNKSLGATYNPDGMIPTGSVDFTLDLIDTYGNNGWQKYPDFYGNINKGVTLKDENGNIINDKHGNPIDDIKLENIYNIHIGENSQPPYDKKTIEFTVPNIETTKLYITTGDEFNNQMTIVLSTPDYPYTYKVEGTSAENKTDELFLDYERFVKTLKASNDYWNTLNVQDMSYMFACEEGKTMKFNGDIGNWDVSSVENFEHTFAHNPNFNQDISRWNVSSVTNMSYMFTYGDDLGYYDIFGGANFVNEFQNFPTGAQDWAGFANIVTLPNPVSFPNSRIVTFNATTGPDVSSVTIKFRFEKDPYPYTDPSYNHPPITITPQQTSYSFIVDPSNLQSSTDTFSNFILYIEERDTPVKVENVVIHPTDTPSIPLFNQNINIWKVNQYKTDGTTPTELTYMFSNSGIMNGNPYGLTVPTPTYDEFNQNIGITGSNPVIIERGSTYTDAGAVAASDVTNLTTNIPLSGFDTSVTGRYSVIYSGTKGDEIVTATRTVNVVDTTPPIITANLRSTINNGQTSLGSVSANEPVTWSTNNPDIQIDGQGNVSLKQPANYKEKTYYSFTIIATDPSNNTRTTNGNVSVYEVFTPETTDELITALNKWYEIANNN